MVSEYPEKKQEPAEHFDEDFPHPQPPDRESARAALALLLGPQTDYAVRVRAARRLARLGPEQLPLLLKTLSTYPEITAPPWPWWPPQYEHCSRLLVYLSQQTQVRLEDLLLHPSVLPSAGPVLWTSIMEAASLLPRGNYEELLCQGLETPWISVRYAAAMALTTKAGKGALQKQTLARLCAHQRPDEAVQVRLTVAYALLLSGESGSLETLIQFMHPLAPEEVRKAAAFILATDLPTQLSSTQQEQLTWYFLQALQDPNMELALYAAHALSRIALPSVVSSLDKQLDQADIQTQIVILTAFEEMAQQGPLRNMMRQMALPARLLPFISADSTDVRRQAAYALAACGGEYVEAVLGTIVLNHDHPGHLEAIDSLRLLHGVLNAPIRINVVRWLLRILSYDQTQEEIQITALDSLAYLLWQARSQNHRQAWHDISQEILYDETTLHLLSSGSAWVRQRTIELLGILGDQIVAAPGLHAHMLYLLYRDNDSGVRACVAYVCGLITARWALPGLLQALLDPDEHVAMTALTALGKVATVDDSIVLYVVKEITLLRSPNAPLPHPLAQEGCVLLKRWRQSQRKESRKKLHSSP